MESGSASRATTVQTHSPCPNLSPTSLSNPAISLPISVSIFSFYAYDSTDEQGSAGIAPIKKVINAEAKIGVHNNFVDLLADDDPGVTVNLADT